MAIKIKHSWEEHRPVHIDRFQYDNLKALLEEFDRGKSNSTLNSSTNPEAYKLKNPIILFLLFISVILIGNYTALWFLSVIGVLGAFIYALQLGFLLMYDIPSGGKRMLIDKNTEIDIRYAESHFKTLSRSDKYKYNLMSPYDIFRGRQKQRYPNLYD